MISPESLGWATAIGAWFAFGWLSAGLWRHYRREGAEDCPIPGCARWWRREDDVEGREVHHLDELVTKYIAPAGTEEPPWARQARTEGEALREAVEDARDADERSPLPAPDLSELTDDELIAETNHRAEAHEEANRQRHRFELWRRRVTDERTD